MQEGTCMAIKRQKKVDQPKESTKVKQVSSHKLSDVEEWVKDEYKKVVHHHQENKEVTLEDQEQQYIHTLDEPQTLDRPTQLPAEPPRSPEDEGSQTIDLHTSMTGVELPIYIKDEKRYRALKIDDVYQPTEHDKTIDPDIGAWILPVDILKYGMFKVSKEYVDKFSPAKDGYWFLHDDDTQDYLSGDTFATSYKELQVQLNVPVPMMQ